MTTNTGFVESHPTHGSAIGLWSILHSIACAGQRQIPQVSQRGSASLTTQRAAAATRGCGAKVQGDIEMDVMAGLEPTLVLNRPPKCAGGANRPTVDERLIRRHKPSQRMDLVQGNGFRGVMIHCQSHYVFPPSQTRDFAATFRAADITSGPRIDPRGRSLRFSAGIAVTKV